MRTMSFSYKGHQVTFTYTGCNGIAYHFQQTVTTPNPRNGSQRGRGDFEVQTRSGEYLRVLAEDFRVAKMLAARV